MSNTSENSRETVLNLLTEFIVCEIGSKALDGITYALVGKEEKDRERYNRYIGIRETITKCGYNKEDIFRVYELSNGYIFDLDLNITKRISTTLVKAVAKTSELKINSTDLIGDGPDKRRKSDMLGLSKYIQKEYNSGNSVVEVALFSRNSVPHIIITGKDNETGKLITVKYNAYAIRHWDIESINSLLLIPAGVRVYKVEPFYILPTKTGVVFKLYIEKC